VNNPVDVHDLHATILHCLGVDHTRLTYKFQGRHVRLTDVRATFCATCSRNRCDSHGLETSECYDEDYTVRLEVIPIWL